MEEIVISGISGRFPESGNMKEFRDNLLNGLNMVTVNDRRFKPGIYGIPEGFGAVKELDKFDAEFFHVFPAQASRMDPQLRISLETTYEAMQDAGVNPVDERESRTGVFYGVCFNEASFLWNAQASKIEGSTMTGCAGAMFANRISYVFDFNGPSCTVDTACSTSIVALQAAIKSIRAGECDSAIVTASTIILTPHTTLQFHKLGMLAPDYACKSFDSSGNGYVRSEAIATIYLQKKSVAKRIYASVLNVKTNTDGFKDAGISFPSASLQKELFQEVYEEGGINKDEVVYVEAHGTGTAAGDPQEFLSLSQTFLKPGNNRKHPLYIGSVKSNMGHSEAASGLCGIAKIVIALQEGVIPGNLHYTKSTYGMKGLRDGTIEIVSKNTRLRPGLVALNSFGFGGVNCHLVLKPHTKHLAKLGNSSKTCNLPRIITMSGCTDSGLRATLKSITQHQNKDLCNLINSAFKSSIPEHTFRGFTIPEAKQTRVEEVGKEIPSLWIVFNGIGSQWAGMGKDLMVIPIFAQSLRKSTLTLHNKFDYNLMAILNREELEDDPTSIFVSIAAIQIGIVDVLSTIGVKPRGFIGHSAGEMLCGYMDGCLSAEETIICAYLRGISLNSGIHKKEKAFGMAVIGDTWERISRTCPKGIYPACHNGLDSVTVSGPLELLEPYLRKVKEEKRLAKQVNSCGIAFHSPYIELASEEFLKSLRKLISRPLARSNKWISSSVKKENWLGSKATKASADYYNNNFKSPVLFYEALKEIPENSTIVEIGPSGLLRGLIKKACPTCTVIPTQSRDTKNGVGDLLTAIGQMYIQRIEIDVNQLYDDVEFPVPLGTPMISPLIQWDHVQSWDVPVYGKNGEFLENTFEVDLSNETDRYLVGHQLQGRVLFPATAYLALVWQSFAQMHQTHYEKFPVVFENVKFNRVTVLRDTGRIEFRVNVSDISGNFEIKEGDAVIVTGTIRSPIEIEYQVHEYDFNDIQEKICKEENNTERFERHDIYKQLRFSGYEYSGIFKGIKARNMNDSSFRMDWKENWPAFLDTCLQTSLGIFEDSTVQTHLPIEIQKMIIYPADFLNFIKNNESAVKETGIFLLNQKSTGIIRCKGIEISGFKTTAVSSVRREPEPTLSPYSFVPFLDDNIENPVCPIIQSVTIIMENIKSSLVTTVPEIVEFNKEPGESDSLKISKLIREDFATSDINYNLYSEECKDDMIAKFAKSNIKLKPIEKVHGDINFTDQRYDIMILDNHIFIRLALDYIRKGGFILCKIPIGTMSRERFMKKLGSKFNLIMHRRTKTHDYFLGRKMFRKSSENTKVVAISSRDLSWVTSLRDIFVHNEELMREKSELPLVYLLSNGDEEEDSGLMGLVLCLRKEPVGQQIRSIFSRDKIDMDFENKTDLLKEIVKLDLAYVVVQKDVLGSYIHSPITSFTKLTKPTRSVFLGMETVGDLSTLKWIQNFDFAKFPQTENYEHVKVEVASLNFKDIMLSSGNLQPEKKTHLPFNIESPLGIEFSGVTKNGDRVCGFSEGQSLATDVLACNDWLWKIPNDWSFEDAATIPVVYSTVYLALIMRGQMQSGESILIHAGAGGIGLAALQVATTMNCNVFTTVSSKEKINHIRQQFPQIPEKHIGYSRDTSFELMIMNETKGRGVDLILNSLSGKMLEATVRCLARHGRFLEIGKVDLVSNKSMGMSLFLKDASYHGVMLDSLADAHQAIRSQLKNLIQKGITTGAIKPLPFRIFNQDQVEPAFRYLAQGRHIGKVLIKFEAELTPALQHVYFDPEKSYIIIGGLGGVGLELINWMTIRYARIIVITSRSGVTSSYQKKYMNTWKERGILVKILQIDASFQENAEILVQEAEKLGPIGGFFNLAMHLEIGLMKVQTEEGFSAVMGPKVDLTRHIDSISRKKCQTLDHFVVFSSVAAAFGFDGQSNYGQANSAGERIIEQRVRDGLPGKAIQWGPIGEVGGWHDNYNADFTQTSFHGSGVQSIHSVLKSLDILLSHESPVILSRRTMEAGNVAEGGNSNLGVIDRIAHILGHTSNKKLNPNAKLTELGMDSVMSMEVRQILEQDFNLTLSAVEIRGSSLKQLEELANNNPRNKMTHSVVKPKAATSDMFQLNFIKTMSRSRFEFKDCVYPINVMAEERYKDNRIVEGRPKSNGSIFIINSIEGPDVLRLLASLTHLPCYSMQMATDAPYETIYKLENYYFQKLKEVEPEGPYTIVGYSAGIFVGIELSLRLEKMRQLNKYILLDMSPARFQAILDENFGTDRSNLDETDIMITMMTQVLGLDRNDIEKYLRKETSMQKRIELVVEILGNIFEETVDVAAIEKAMSAKGKSFLQMFDSYRPTGVLQSKVVLVKTTQNLISYDSVEFWGVEEFCSSPPEVQIMDTTHSYLITEPTVRHVANCINND